MKRSYSISELATLHLDSMREHQPEGPLHIIGWSSGGLLAYEVARQAEEMNDPVAFVGIIDEPVPSFVSTQSLESFAIELIKLMKYFGEKHHFSIDSNHATLARMSKEEQIAAVFNQMPVLSSVSNDVMGYVKNFLLASLDYSPSKLKNTPLTIILTDDTAQEFAEVQATSALDWKTYTSGLFYQENVYGEHFSILEEASYIDDIAEFISQCVFPQSTEQKEYATQQDATQQDASTLGAVSDTKPSLWSSNDFLCLLPSAPLPLPRHKSAPTESAMKKNKEALRIQSRMLKQRLRQEQLRQEQLMQEQLMQEQLMQEQLMQEQLMQEQLMQEQLMQEQLMQEQLRQEQLMQERLRQEQLQQLQQIHLYQQQQYLENEIAQEMQAQQRLNSALALALQCTLCHQMEELSVAVPLASRCILALSEELLVSQRKTLGLLELQQQLSQRSNLVTCSIWSDQHRRRADSLDYNVHLKRQPGQGRTAPHHPASSSGGNMSPR
jgi:thioesterase domain-containing protein